MREGLRGEASEMMKSILAVVLESAEMWSRDVIEVRFCLFYTACLGSRGTRQILHRVFEGLTIVPFVPRSCMSIALFDVFCFLATIACSYFSHHVFFAMSSAPAYLDNDSNLLLFT